MGRAHWIAPALYPGAQRPLDHAIVKRLGPVGHAVAQLVAKIRVPVDSLVFTVPGNVKFAQRFIFRIYDIERTRILPAQPGPAPLDEL